MDMMKMMGKLKEVQDKMKEAQEGLSELRINAESGAGMVQVTLNGKKELVNITVDDSLIKTEDKQLMIDLIIAAVNKGIEEANEKAQDHLKNATQGLVPNIPGLDLSGMA